MTKFEKYARAAFDLSDPNSSRAQWRACRPGRQAHQTGILGVIPCANCHGALGQGQASVPRLAGQPATFLYQQIQVLTLKLRPGEPTNHHACHMNAEQMKDLAAYLGSR